MERLQKIQLEGSTLMEPVLFNRLKEIQTFFLSNRLSIISDFNKSLEMVYSEAQNLQRLKMKDPIQFLSISYLQRCIYTKNYEVRLDLYNKDFYLDRCRTVQYWNTSFLFQFFEKDMDYFKRHANSLVFQIKEYEEKAFGLWYITHYYKILELFLKHHITDIIHHNLFEVLEKTDDFKIVYGGYMEEQVVLHVERNCMS